MMHTIPFMSQVVYSYIHSSVQKKCKKQKQTRRMAIANGMCVSLCNQPKAHYLATSRESRRYVVAFRFAAAGIWLRQESLRHILASPGYAPGIIAVNVAWMERGFNACQKHRSIYPSIFNPFPSNSTRKFKNSSF